MLGYTREELLDMKVGQLDDDESKARTPARLKELAEKGSIKFEVNHRRKDGTWIPLEVHASRLTIDGKNLIMSVARDIAERKRLQGQVMAQDRLASIGQLVAGVAHEVNNPLTAVIGFSSLLLERELPGAVRADLEIVDREARRAALIVKNLLTFARKQPEGKAPVDIHQQLNEVLQLRLLELSLDSIEVSLRFAPDLPPIMGNASQLQQVFFNIIVNAEQSMLDARNGGHLTVTTERVGEVVRVSIDDDGRGISHENLSRIFTPFFTTKDVGKGTGLGLSICHGIVTEHGGRIYAESEFGKGARFIVELPLHE